MPESASRMRWRLSKQPRRLTVPRVTHCPQSNLSKPGDWYRPCNWVTVEGGDLSTDKRAQGEHPTALQILKEPQDFEIYQTLLAKRGKGS